jgi:hypothetical protein
VKPRQIESAMVKVLRAGLDEAFYVDFFEGDMAVLDRWISTVQLPAVAVYYSGRHLTPPDETGAMSGMDAEFSVWAIHDRLRGTTDAMQRTGGMYDVLEATETLLAASDLGLAISPLFLQDEEPIFADERSGRIIWRQVWVTHYVTV